MEGGMEGARRGRPTARECVSCRVRAGARRDKILLSAVAQKDCRVGGRDAGLRISLPAEAHPRVAKAVCPDVLPKCRGRYLEDAVVGLCSNSHSCRQPSP